MPRPDRAARANLRVDVKVDRRPTHDGESEGNAENRAYVVVSRDGALVPEAKVVIAFVKEHQLTLETGHSTPAEQLMIVREAKQQGAEHIIVTHEGNISGAMTMASLKEAAWSVHRCIPTASRSLRRRCALPDSRSTSSI